MNKDLQFLLDTGKVKSKRSLAFVHEGMQCVYVTEYLIDAYLGPFKFYVTWMNPCCTNTQLLNIASIYIHPARARLYFPSFLDVRIPPENRVGIRGILDTYDIKDYDKFDLIIATGGYSPISWGHVVPIEPVDCDFEVIHAIEEIVAEYNRNKF